MDKGKIEQATVMLNNASYLSLSKMMGKKVTDIVGYVSPQYGDDPSFILCRVMFEDGSQAAVEGEHDCPYLTEGYGDKPSGFTDELLADYYEEDPED